MTLIDLTDLPKSGPLIGIDPGSKTLGIAASDGLRLIASPVTTIARTKLAKDLAALFALYDDRGAVGPVSYTHLPSPRDRTRSRMPSSA